MLKTFRILMFSALAALAWLAPVQAATTLNSTTLSVAVDANTTTVTLTSATNVSVGHLIFVDREAMKINSLTGAVARVTRGWSGTAARAHEALAIAYTGAPERFYSSEVVGTCSTTTELYLPHIVLPTGNVYQCTNSVWYLIGASVGSFQVSFQQGATPADALDTIFFLADRDYVVTAVSAVWGTAETTGSMDIMVEKLTGTTACASGTDILSAAIAATGTANTVNAGSLSATASALQLAAGNRLCVDLTATPNEVANMVVTVTLAPR